MAQPTFATLNLPLASSNIFVSESYSSLDKTRFSLGVWRWNGHRIFIMDKRTHLFHIIYSILTKVGLIKTAESHPSHFKSLMEASEKKLVASAKLYHHDSEDLVKENEELKKHVSELQKANKLAVETISNLKSQPPQGDHTNLIQKIKDLTAENGSLQEKVVKSNQKIEELEALRKELLEDLHKLKKNEKAAILSNTSTPHQAVNEDSAKLKDQIVDLERKLREEEKLRLEAINDLQNLKKAQGKTTASDSSSNKSSVKPPVAQAENQQQNPHQSAANSEDQNKDITGEVIVTNLTYTPVKKTSDS